MTTATESSPVARLRTRLESLRNAMARDTAGSTRASFAEYQARSREFFEALEAVYSQIEPPVVRAADPILPFDMLPWRSRARAVIAVEEGVRRLIGMGSSSQHQEIATNVWNAARSK